MVPEGFCKYDKWGNMIYLAAGDGKGNLIINPQTGWSIRRSEYDSRGNLLAESFYNEKDEPLISPANKYFKAVCSYTREGKEREKSYYDTAGKPMLGADGYHKVLYEYNERAQTTKMTYLGTTGKPIDCKYGFHRVEWSYGPDNVMQYRKYFNASGKLLLTEKWNGTEWVSTTPVVAPSTGWQKEISDLQSELPMDLGENANYLVVVSFLQTGSNSCEITFKAPKSKYEMSQTELTGHQDNVKIVVNEYKKEKLPSSVTLTGILFDSKGRKLYTIKK